MAAADRGVEEMTASGKKHPLRWILPLGELFCFGGLTLAWWVLDPADPAAGIDFSAALYGGCMLGAAVLSVAGVLYGVYMTFAGEGRLLLRPAFWGKLALSLFQGVNLLSILLAMAAGAVAFGALLGPAGLLGVGFFGALWLGWLYLTGLGPSACLAAFVWDGVRRGERGIAPALVYTILLLIPAADAIAAVVLFLAARPGDGTRAAGKANR